MSNKKPVDLIVLVVLVVIATCSSMCSPKDAVASRAQPDPKNCRVVHDPVTQTCYVVCDPLLG